MRLRRSRRYSSNNEASTLPAPKRQRLTLVRATNALSTPPSSQLAQPSSASAEPADPKPFPFMKLPAELRLHIYRMALVRPNPILLHLPRATDGENSGAHHDDDSRPVLDEHDIRVGRRTMTYRGNQQPSTNKFLIELNSEPITPELLRVSQVIHREARQVLYADNKFVLQLDSAIHTLAALHQRSRSLIKHVLLTIPTHHDILEGFADLVRLGLRYCWGLKTFHITLPSMFPDDRNISSATNVYANAFHILRWLPKNCTVELEGNVNAEIRRVVEDNCMLANTLTDAAYQKRQHQMPDRH